MSATVKPVDEDYTHPFERLTKEQRLARLAADARIAEKAAETKRANAAKRKADAEQAQRPVVSDPAEEVRRARTVNLLREYLRDGDEWEPRVPTTVAWLPQEQAQAEAREVAAVKRRTLVTEATNSLGVTREALAEVLGITREQLDHYTEHGSSSEPNGVMFRRLLSLVQQGELPNVRS